MWSGIKWCNIYCDSSFSEAGWNAGVWGLGLKHAVEGKMVVVGPAADLSVPTGEVAISNRRGCDLRVLILERAPYAIDVGSRGAVVSAALLERKVAGSIPTIGDFHTVGPCKKAVFACLATDVNKIPVPLPLRYHHQLRREGDQPWRIHVAGEVWV